MNAILLKNQGPQYLSWPNVFTQEGLILNGKDWRIVINVHH